MRYLEVFIASLLQILLWVGGIIATGFLVALINTLFYKVVGRKSRKVCIITGAIGTPIHELGHALFCLIFFNRITEIKLFTPNSDDGTIGHVTHTVPNNPWSKLGQFFIGVGPIILGAGVLSLLMFLLANNVFKVFTALMEFFSNGVGGNTAFVDYFTFVAGGINLFIGEMFSITSFKNPLWYLYIILGSFISIHMRLSKADIKGSKTGLILVIALVFLVPFITGLISMKAFNVVSQAMTTGGVSVLCVYIMVIMMALLTLFIACFVRLMIFLIKKLVQLIKAAVKSIAKSIIKAKLKGK